MNLSYRALKSRISSLNEQRHLEKDFYGFCESEGIDVCERKFKRPGYYAACGAGDYIFLDSRLLGWNRLEVMFHELVHALVHYPADFLTRRQQLQAEVLSLVLLIPRRMLFELQEVPFEEIEPALVPLLVKRQRIFEIYRI